jgi:hypothetical protein
MTAVSNSIQTKSKKKIEFPTSLPIMVLVQSERALFMVFPLELQYFPTRCAIINAHSAFPT